MKSYKDIIHNLWKCMPARALSNYELLLHYNFMFKMSKENVQIDWDVLLYPFRYTETFSFVLGPCKFKFIGHILNL